MPGKERRFVQVPPELTEYAALPVVSEEVDAVGRVGPEGGPAGAELRRWRGIARLLLSRLLVVIHGQSIGGGSNWILPEHANGGGREMGREKEGGL